MPTVSIAQAYELGLQHHQAGRLTEAESVYRQILAQDPNHAGCLHLLGLLAWNGGRIDIAEQFISRAVAKRPDEPAFHYNLGIIYRRMGRLPEATKAHREAVRLNPNYGEGYFELGLVLGMAGQPEESLEAYRAAHRCLPNDPGILSNMGNLLRSMGRVAEAVQCFERGLQINPHHVETLGNIGQLCESQGRYQEAIVYYERALKINPGHPTLHYNMGVSLAEMGREKDAVPYYQQAIRLKPDYFEAYNNLANALKLGGRFDEAIDAFHQALRLNPGLMEAWTNLAAAQISCARHEEAMANLQKAMELSPQNARTHSNYVYTRIFLPQMDARMIRADHELWNQRHAAPLKHLVVPHSNDRDPQRRLRIGYVSPDFRDHVVARNLMPFFRERDREHFEAICYSNTAVKDAMTDSIRTTVDNWHDIRFQTDEAVAQLIRRDRIDILVDLSLHMAWSRLTIFAHKPAPVQVTFAGYPGSTGLETMDYRLTDPYLDPPGVTDNHYSEKSIRLPHTFWCYDPLGEEVAPNELPSTGNGFVTFGCLNAFSKINEPLIGLWSQVLAAVEKSRLLILCPQGKHRERTLEFFKQHGVAPERIEFVAPVPRAKYLRLYHNIDIVLDPLPYNGHTTSLDALWMGVPVVTMPGATVVGRAGVSQLMNLGLPELIAQDAASYVAIAANLARNPARLTELRATLRGRMERSPLMDAKSFTRGIESAYLDMWKNWCASGTDNK